MLGITYLTGDAAHPRRMGAAIIAHAVSDAGRWGQGFVAALSRRWPGPEAAYRAWAAGQLPGFGLGAMQLVDVGGGLHVANLCAKSRADSDDAAALRLEALDRCFQTLAKPAARFGAGVHMPRIGARGGGGDWPKIEAMIAQRLGGAGVAVFVYDPPPPAP